MPLRDHLEQVYKTTGVKPAQLKAQPPFPEKLRYVYHWYLDVRGSEGVTWTELRNWSEMTHQKPLAWEVDLLRTLDRVFWREYNQ